jgi:hypothetical protein
MDSMKVKRPVQFCSMRRIAVFGGVVALAVALLSAIVVPNTVAAPNKTVTGAETVGPYTFNPPITTPTTFAFTIPAPTGKYVTGAGWKLVQALDPSMTDITEPHVNPITSSPDEFGGWTMVLRVTPGEATKDGVRGPITTGLVLYGVAVLR